MLSVQIVQNDYKFTSSSFLPSIDRLKGKENFDERQAFFEHEDFWRFVEDESTSSTQQQRRKMRKVQSKRNRN